MAAKNKSTNTITLTVGDYEKDEIYSLINQTYGRTDVPIECRVYRKNPKTGIEESLHKFDYLPDEFDDLQTMFGGGTFYLRIRYVNPDDRSDRKFVTKNVVIAGPAKEWNPPTAATTGGTAVNAREQLIGDIKFARELLGTGNNDNAMMTMMIENNKQNTTMMIEASKQSMAMFTAMIPLLAKNGDGVTQKLIEKIVTTGFDKANQSEIDTYLKIHKVLGPGEANDNFSITGLIKEFIPVLPGVISAFQKGGGNNPTQGVNSIPGASQTANPPITAGAGAKPDVSLEIANLGSIVNQNFRNLANEVVLLTNKVKMMELDKFRALSDEFTDELLESEKINIFKEIVTGLGPADAYKIMLECEAVADLAAYNEWNKKAGFAEYTPVPETQNTAANNLKTLPPPSSNGSAQTNQTNTSEMDAQNKLYAAALKAMPPAEKIEQLKKNIKNLGIDTVYLWCIQYMDEINSLEDFNKWMADAGLEPYKPN